jgi:hypothetical protein
MTTWLIALSFTALNGTAERAFAPCFSFCRDPGAVAQSGCRLFLRESSFGGPPFPSAVMLILTAIHIAAKTEKLNLELMARASFSKELGSMGEAESSKFSFIFNRHTICTKLWIFSRRWGLPRLQPKAALRAVG